MPKVTIRFAESAVVDLEAIKQRYSTQGLAVVGDRLITEIFERIEALRDHPDVGRMVPEFGQPFLRELIHPPFRIVCRREPKKVRVVRIWRSERLLQLPTDEDDPER
jgi:plasmid stabilization system protein ParE